MSSAETAPRLTRVIRHRTYRSLVFRSGKKNFSGRNGRHHTGDPSPPRRGPLSPARSAALTAHHTRTSRAPPPGRRHTHSLASPTPRSPPRAHAPYGARPLPSACHIGDIQTSVNAAGPESSVPRTHSHSRVGFPETCIGVVLRISRNCASTRKRGNSFTLQTCMHVRTD